MLEIIRTIVGRLSGDELAPPPRQALPKVPVYAENWGTRQFGGTAVSRAVLVLVVPAENSAVHGMELQLHRYGDKLRLSIYLCPRPPTTSSVVAKETSKLGLELSPFTGCPLGKRLEFLQSHLRRGYAGSGPEIVLEPTVKNLKDLIRKLRGAQALISNNEAREAVANLLEQVLLIQSQGSPEAGKKSGLTLPPFPKL